MGNGVVYGGNYVDQTPIKCLAEGKKFRNSTTQPKSGMDLPEWVPYVREANGSIWIRLKAAGAGDSGR